MGLGAFPAVSPTEAHEKAAAARKQLASGLDPLGEGEAKRQAAAGKEAQATTFVQAAAAYIAANKAGWRNEKHAAQWESTIAAHATPTLGKLACSAISTADVFKVLQPIWATKPETASRLRRRVEQILDYAKTQGWRIGENPAAWRGNLALRLPARAKMAPVVHHAALDWHEAPAFMAALREREGIGARALEFGILTDARSGEVRVAMWSEIDMEGAEWRIPALRVKAAQPHRVPLSRGRLRFYVRWRRSRIARGLVFIGRDKGVPMSDMTLTAVLRRMGKGDLTAHGFRNTFRDWAAESTHHPNHIVEQAPAHSIGSVVEAAYRRGDLVAKRRALVDDEAAYRAKPAAQVVRRRFGEQQRS